MSKPETYMAQNLNIKTTSTVMATSKSDVHPNTILLVFIQICKFCVVCKPKLRIEKNLSIFCKKMTTHEQN